MLKIGEFESAFRAAAKQRFALTDITIERPLFLHDLTTEERDEFQGRLAGFLDAFCVGVQDMPTLAKSQYSDLGQMLSSVQAQAPDLVCTYRNLGTDGWKMRYSLGEDLELLCQELEIPVLVVPHPKAGKEAEHALDNTSRVMVVADHLTGDNHLVDYGVACAEQDGTVILTHVEALSTYEYYMGIIDRIVELDSDVARQEIKDRLLKEPAEYIGSVADALKAAGARITVESEVLLGHRLPVYRDLIQKHRVDLLVLNGKDPMHNVMHPMAYPLAVELDEIPLMLL